MLCRLFGLSVRLSVCGSGGLLALVWNYPFLDECHMCRACFGVSSTDAAAVYVADDRLMLPIDILRANQSVCGIADQRE